MHPRSLQCALASEGTSFRELAQETRLALAKQMVETQL
jgi:lambda repressor-like predicted transcriptional regulator